MTPLGIEILMHCYYSPDPYPRLHSTSVSKELQIFLANGLIGLGDDYTVDRPTYKVTERGRAHVMQLCSLPWPVAAWIDANGQPIPIKRP